MLRTGLENLCLTSQAFITIKNQFIKSIAVFSIASYLIGIGDRHLENFLVDTTDGEVLGIDFGIAFGSGVDLTTPELMPFRLTQQIEGVIAPHPLEGAYKQTMVHTLRALRKNKSLILDTCDIFVKEPLLDWTKEAKKKLQQQLSEDEPIEEKKSHEREMEALSFLPKQKIDKVKKKIAGVNPVLILKQELSESTHASKKYYKQLCETIQGPIGSQRNTLLAQKKTFLDVEEQVDCLIETARDPDILGRVWLGWSAYI